MPQDASIDLQEAVFAALDNDATLTAAVTGIYDGVPPNTNYPYVDTGESTSTDNSTKTTNSWVHRLTIHVWSQSDDFTELTDIMGLIDGLLHNASLSLTDHSLILIQRENRDRSKDIDPRIRHGVLIYRAITQAT